MNNPSICVIHNPSSGRGRGAKRLEALRRRLGDNARFVPTTAAGHAETLALTAAQAGTPVVAAAGGDGTVHEVANGILAAARPDIALAVLPIGSANDYASSLERAECWTQPAAEKGARWVDVGRVHDPTGRSRWFVNSLGLGFNGAVTLESRRIKRLQGMALYGAAVLRALWSHYRTPIMRVELDGVLTREPTLAMSLALGHREGNFAIAPNARLDDGWFDSMHAGPLGFGQTLSLLPGLLSGRPPIHPLLRFGRCRTARVHSAEPLIVHVDGEFFATPADAVHEIEVELLPRALRVCTV